MQTNRVNLTYQQFFGLTQYSAVFCVLSENKKSRFRLEIRILLSFAFLLSGATRNRDKFTSGCISLLFRIALTAISSYCSTAGLLHSAHRGSGWFLGVNIVIYLELPSFLSLNLLISLSKSLSSSSISRLR